MATAAGLLADEPAPAEDVAEAVDAADDVATTAARAIIAAVQANDVESLAEVVRTLTG